MQNVLRGLAALGAVVLLLGAGSLLLQGGGNVPPPDPYAEQRAALQWQEEQADAARREVVLDGLIGCLGGIGLLSALAVGIALYGLAGRVWWDVRARARGVQLVWPDAQGQLPYPTEALAASVVEARRALAQRTLVAVTAARASQTLPAHWHNEVHGAEGGGSGPEAAEAEADGAEIDPVFGGVPGPITLSALWDGGWRPSPQSILIGQAAAGRTLDSGLGEETCHAGIIGVTGGGKTNVEMLLAVQLIALGAEVYWLNHKYTPVHPGTGFNFAAVAARTTPGRVLMDKAEEIAVLRALAEQELPARKARFNRGQVPGVPRYYIIDEAPGLVAYDKATMDYLAETLREGRELGLFIIMAAQDILVKTLGGSVGLQGQFVTAVYTGGDAVSAQRLMKVSLPEPPGRGVVWARGRRFPQPTPARIPLVDNAGVTRLLGPGRAEVAPELVERLAAILAARRGGAEKVPEGAERAETPESGDPVARLVQGIRANEIVGQALPLAQQEAVARRLWLERVPQAEILRLLYRVNPGGSQGYKDALAQYRQWLNGWTAQPEGSSDAGDLGRLDPNGHPAAAA